MSLFLFINVKFLELWHKRSNELFNVQHNIRPLENSTLKPQPPPLPLPLGEGVGGVILLGGEGRGGEVVHHNYTDSF